MYDHGIYKFSRKYERVLKSLIAHKEKEEMLIERDNQHMQEIKDIDEKLEQFKITAQQQVDRYVQKLLNYNILQSIFKDT